MLARIAILTATLLAIAPTAHPLDLAALAVAVAHVERVLPVDVPAMLAVAHIETNGTFRADLVSPKGACGVLQTMPRWSVLTCEEMKSPLGGVVAGLVAWHSWRGDPAKYNGGARPGKRARWYAREWARQRRRVVAAMGE